MDAIKKMIQHALAAEADSTRASDWLNTRTRVRLLPAGALKYRTIKTYLYAEDIASLIHEAEEQVRQAIFAARRGASAAEVCGEREPANDDINPEAEQAHREMMTEREDDDRELSRRELREMTAEELREIEDEDEPGAAERNEQRFNERGRRLIAEAEAEGDLDRVRNLRIAFYREDIEDYEDDEEDDDEYEDEEDDDEYEDDDERNDLDDYEYEDRRRSIHDD